MIHLKCSHLQKNFLANNDVESNFIKPLVIKHLSNLLKKFQKYFLSELDNTNFRQIQNPFAMQKRSTEHLSLLNFRKSLLIYFLTPSCGLNFLEKKLHRFWLSVRAEYPLLSDLAVTAFLLFVSTYLCESAFSTLTQSKQNTVPA